MHTATSGLEVFSLTIDGHISSHLLCTLQPPRHNISCKTELRGEPKSLRNEGEQLSACIVQIKTKLPAKNIPKTWALIRRLGGNIVSICTHGLTSHNIMPEHGTKQNFIIKAWNSRAKIELNSSC